MDRRSLVFVFLIFGVCLATEFEAIDLGATQASMQSICLYTDQAQTTLKPLQLKNTDCPKNTSYCMNAIYKYGNFQYNGISALKPVQGEVASFLVQSENGLVDFVTLLNTKMTVTSKVWVQITGAQPTNPILKDDPQDGWLWDSSTNSGNFTWTTQPGYTDGVVIGHINFTDNYCVSASFTQTAGAITTASIMSGTTANVSRVLSVPYTSGTAFEFCQYPVTASTYTNATCPGKSDGTARISVVFGPKTMTFTWLNSKNVVVGNTASVSGLPTGTYTIYATDPSANGCNAQRSVTIWDNTLNGVDVTANQFTCTATKGSASATPDGGSGGFTYQWTKVGSTTVLGTDSSISGLSVGSYSLTVTDSCGSTASSNFAITSSGCCGDGTCDANEGCTSATYCAADCGACCPPGTKVNGDACDVCPPGSRNSATQSTSCTPCPANTFNAGGNDTCAPCPVNYFSDAGSGKCVRCPAGQVRGTSDSSCSACPAGQFAPCDDSTCTDCTAGTFSTSGSTFCSTCAAGTSSDDGAASCTACSAGSYSSAGSSSCTACPTGTTTPAAGATHLLACN